MNNLSNLSVGDRVAVVTNGRKTSWVADATVTKVTPKQILAKINTATSALRFNRESGYAVESHRSDRLITLEDETYARLKAEQDERNSAAAAARAAEQAQIDARFGVEAAAGGDPAVLRVLMDLARDVITSENKLRQRLSVVTPERLYSELSWLMQCAPESAKLSWLLGLFAAIAKLEAGRTVRQLLADHRDFAREKLLRPYSTLDNIDTRAELLAARDIYATLDGHLKYTLTGAADADVVSAVMAATTGEQA